MMLQRAVLLCALVALALASSKQSNRDRQHRASRESDDSYDWDYPYAGAWADTGFGYPWGGAAAVSGFPMWNRPFWPVWPVMRMPVMVPWYKGPHVCVETKYFDRPAEIEEMLKDVPFDFHTEESSARESCKGNNECYICEGSKMHNGKMKHYVTKYKCCHGFVRNYRGPGCIESDKDTSQQSPNTKEKEAYPEKEIHVSSSSASSYNFFHDGGKKNP